MFDLNLQTLKILQVRSIFCYVLLLPSNNSTPIRPYSTGSNSCKKFDKNLFDGAIKEFYDRIPTRGASFGFPGTGNPPHNAFLCIFKHNEVFTCHSTAFSDKVGMGSPFLGTRNPCGFPVLTNSEPMRVSRSYELGTHAGFPFLRTRNRCGFPVLTNSEPMRVSRSYELGTHAGFPSLRTRNPCGFPVLTNSEPMRIPRNPGPYTRSRS
jgi:hypothetical protein